jgi:hypothetical protein
MRSPVELEQCIRATAREIRGFCKRNKVAVAADGAIPEEWAARALGYASADTLRKQCADALCPVPHRLLGNKRLYRIVDIAREIELKYNDG